MAAERYNKSYPVNLGSDLEISINDFVNLFMIGYEWENRINYEIVDSLDELISSEDIAFYKEYFIGLDEKITVVNSRKALTERIFRKLSSYLKVLK